MKNIYNELNNEDYTDSDDNIDGNSLEIISPIDPNDNNMKNNIQNIIDVEFKKNCKLLEDHIFNEHDETTAAFTNDLLSYVMENIFAGKLSFTDMIINVITDMKIRIEKDNTLLLKMKHSENIPIAKIFQDVSLESLNDAIDRIPLDFPVDRDVLVNKLSILFNINEDNLVTSTSSENDDTDRIHVEI